MGWPAAFGAWGKFKKSLWCRIESYREESAGPTKLRKIRTANTEMQIAVIIGVPGCSIHFQPRDDSATQPRPNLWTKGYIPCGTDG